MTDKTMVMSARIPLETKLALSDIDLRKFLENVAMQRENGEIDIVNNQVVVPEKDDGWDEIKDLLHDRNLTIKQLKQSLQRY